MKVAWVEENNETMSYSSEDEDVEEEGQEGNYVNSGEKDDDTGELSMDSLDSFDDDFESANDNFLVYLEVDSTHEQEFEETDNIPPASAAVCTGYKIVGDNIDKNIRRTHQRIDRTTRSLHYFHMFAVKDRLDFSYLSDHRPTQVEIDIQVLLPGATDLAAIKKDFEILISR